MIRKVTLGPRSRVLEAKEAAERDLGDRVLGGLLPQETLDAVLYPPVPGPANPTSMRGCGCAKWAMPATEEEITVGEWTHRWSKPCFKTDENGVRSYEDFKSFLTVEQRLTAVEKVLADLVARLQT